MTSLDEDLLTFQPSYHQQVLEFTSFVGLLHKDNAFHTDLNMCQLGKSIS